MSQNNFDFTKLFPVKLPTVDVKALMEAQNRNVDAFMKASKILAETAQTLVKRQVEITQANLQQNAEVAKSALSTKDLQASLVQQLDFAKTSTEKASAQVRELSDIATKGGNEALEILRKRAEEGVAEISALTKAAA
jgi:phasin family protein